MALLFAGVGGLLRGLLYLWRGADQVPGAAREFRHYGHASLHAVVLTFGVRCPVTYP